MSLDISHVFFILMACPVVRADNIYVDHRRTISTLGSPRGLGRLMHEVRKARQSEIWHGYHGLITRPSVVGASVLCLTGVKYQSGSEKRRFRPTCSAYTISKTSLTGITIAATPLDHKR